MSDSDFDEEEKSPTKKVHKKLPKIKKPRLDSTQQHHFNHGQFLKYYFWRSKIICNYYAIIGLKVYQFRTAVSNVIKCHKCKRKRINTVELGYNELSGTSIKCSL